MSGREELIGIDQFIYTEVTVGLKKQGPQDNDHGKRANEKLMTEGLASAKKQATLLKLAVLKLIESDQKAKSLTLADVESHYRFFKPDQAGFAKLPTWSNTTDIEKDFGKPGYVLVVDKNLENAVGRTVIHFKKIPDLFLIEKIRMELAQALKKL